MREDLGEDLVREVVDGELSHGRDRPFEKQCLEFDVDGMGERTGLRGEGEVRLEFRQRRSGLPR